ncbi:MAG: NAD-dependent epimerase/dehydratase family protein [Deltaproteobacteria bacterium]|nr:NAD-dependent epimerase/dehydratase family protein [Deltaproteobacteria bacterium]
MALVVVTGASGFLGGALARALLGRGDKIRCVQRSAAPELRALGAEVVQCDLSGDPAAVARAFAGAEAVLHVAAKAGVWGPARVFEAANFTATAQVIEGCKANAIGKLVYTSTPSVVHAGGDVEGVDEAAPLHPDPRSAYAVSKAAAETLVRAANGPDLATVALRPHLIWGPADTQLTARIIARARAGRLRLVGGGLKVIDATYVDNAVEAHLLALDRLGVGAACAGKAYFVANGEPMPQRDLVNGILGAAGLPPCQSSIAPWAAYAAGATLEVVWRLLRRQDEPLLTRFVARQLATAHWYRLDAVRRDLGYQGKVTTAEGLTRLAAWFGASTLPGCGSSRSLGYRTYK